MGCSSKRGAFMLPVVSTTVWRFLIFQNIPVQNAITMSGLICVGEMCPDLAAVLLDAKLQLGKKRCLSFHRATGMGAMRDPAKWLRCSGLNHGCSPGKLGWLHIPFYTLKNNTLNTGISPYYHPAPCCKVIAAEDETIQPLSSEHLGNSKIIVISVISPAEITPTFSPLSEIKTS